jgi:small-conductance mechanosensitive channel
MRGYNIHTVEQLENLSGDAISTVGMGCQEWVNAAKRYMERVNKGVNHHQFEKALADRDQEIRTLKRQLDDVTALIRQQQPVQQPSQILTQAFDAQTAQINASHQSNEPFTPEPARFVQDLSGEVQPKRRPGRPRKSQEH